MKELFIVEIRSKKKWEMVWAYRDVSGAELRIAMCRAEGDKSEYRIVKFLREK